MLSMNLTCVVTGMSTNVPVNYQELECWDEEMSEVIGLGYNRSRRTSSFDELSHCHILLGWLGGRRRQK